jgi:hypothetical protein
LLGKLHPVEIMRGKFNFHSIANSIGIYHACNAHMKVQTALIIDTDLRVTLCVCVCVLVRLNVSGIRDTNFSPRHEGKIKYWPSVLSLFYLCEDSDLIADFATNCLVLNKSFNFLEFLGPHMYNGDTGIAALIGSW